MLNVPIEGVNCTIGEKQPEYTPLIGKREVTTSVRADNGEEYSAVSYTCGYLLSPEEIMALINGGKLYVRQLGGWMPTAMWVE